MTLISKFSKNELTPEEINVVNNCELEITLNLNKFSTREELFEKYEKVVRDDVLNLNITANSKNADGDYFSIGNKLDLRFCAFFTGSLSSLIKASDIFKKYDKDSLVSRRIYYRAKKVISKPLKTI